VARRAIDHAAGTDVASRRSLNTLALHSHFKKYRILWSSIGKTYGADVCRSGFANFWAEAIAQGDSEPIWWALPPSTRVQGIG
jgi:hypothetical protein